VVIRLISVKSKSSRISAPDPQSAADCEIDEALWAAYRRYDKSAVTKQLLRRYLTTVTAVACEATALWAISLEYDEALRETGSRPVAANLPVPADNSDAAVTMIDLPNQKAQLTYDERFQGRRLVGGLA